MTSFDPKELYQYLKLKHPYEYIASRVTTINNGKLIPSEGDYNVDKSVKKKIKVFEENLLKIREKTSGNSITKYLFDNTKLESILLSPKTESDSFFKNDKEEDEKFKCIVLKDEVISIEGLTKKLLDVHKEFNDSLKETHEGLHHYFIQPRFPKVDLTYTFIIIISKKLNELEYKEIKAFVSESAIPLIENHILKHAIKSAKAAIMARNISHNLGSHVIYYIKTAIQSFEILHQFPHLVELDYDAKTKKYIIPQNVLEEAQKVLNNAEKQEANVTAPFLRGLIRFLNYIQERHDYIATISNNHIPYFGGVNFKDFVFDVILPDKKVERHKTEDQELIKYKEQNLLLDYIAKSEKFERKEIKIYFKYKEGVDNISNSKKCVYYNPEKKANDLNEQEEYQLKKLRSLEISLPSGIMGRQAFFSIFENFIRNTAKHQNNKSTERKIEIVISVKPEDNFYTFKLYDKNSSITKDDFDCKIEKALIDSYVKNGALNENNKGIKEMRISAAWLRGLQVEDIEEQSIGGEDDSVLKALYINPETEEESKEIKATLCYEFKVPIAKKMVIISNTKDIIIDEEIKNQFAVLTLEKYLSKDTPKNYKLTVIDEATVDTNDSKEIMAVSNKRCFKDNLSNDNYWKSKNLNTYKLNNLYHTLYKRCINNNLSFKEEIVDISDHEVIIYDSKMGYDDDRELASGIYRIHKNEKVYSDLKYNDSPFIFYKTHSDTESEFKIVMEDNPQLFKKASFIEGISGHNSTDRLIRHEELSEEWRLKMLESALTEITIVDERIFDSYNSEVKTNESGEKINSKDLKPYYKSEVEFEEFIKDNFNHLISSEEYKAMELMIRKNYKFDKKLEKLFLKKINQPKITVANILEKKNIKIFNLNKTEGGENKLSQLNVIDTTVNENKPLKQVHFVCVHQGILEKLKTITDGGINETFERFKAIFPAKHYIIHSGRAKPSNLPNDVAFVQFSSLEAALNDCKYSLSELVYNSIIEKNVNYD